jgi:hypothetical protein
MRKIHANYRMLFLGVTAALQLPKLLTKNKLCFEDIAASNIARRKKMKLAYSIKAPVDYDKQLYLHYYPNDLRKNNRKKVRSKKI